MRLERSPIGVSSTESTLQPAHPVTAAFSALVFGGGDRVDRVGKQHHVGLAARIDDGVETGRLGDLERIGGDVGDDAGNSVDLPRGGAGVPPTTLIAAATACSMMGACSAASIVPRIMPAGFKAIAWVNADERAGKREPCPSRMRKSQPIGLGGLLSAIADSLSSAVFLVGRDVDDQFPGFAPLDRWSVRSRS